MQKIDKRLAISPENRVYKKETNGNFRTKYTESEIKNPLHGLDET